MHLSAHMQTGYHRPAARVAVGSSEELEVGACTGTILAPSSRLRLALEPGCEAAIPELPASKLHELEGLAKPTETRFPDLESSFYFIFFFNVTLFCF